MTVTPSCDTHVVTTQLALLSNRDLPERVVRTRRRPMPRRINPEPVIRLDAHTREVGKSGVAEARRRLAEIMATTERAQQLVQAS